MNNKLIPWLIGILIAAGAGLVFSVKILNKIDQDQAMAAEALASDDDGDGFSENGGDCNDKNPLVHPDASEAKKPGGEVFADKLDNDCDGHIDEGAIDRDNDGDGYCAHISCTDGSEPGDCDDTNNRIHPNAAEWDQSNPYKITESDNIDNNCDGIVDNHTPAFDDDGDGFTEQQGDCNDEEPLIFPGAPEGDLEDGFLFGDTIDNDCDKLVDEGAVDIDNDDDGFCEHTTCLGKAEPGDCDDENASVYPGAPEFMLLTDLEEGYVELDRIDNDCDGIVDNNTPLTDDDGDGLSEKQGDCNDADKNTSPHAKEIADELDNNCNGIVDENTNVFDDDLDGMTEQDGDCDDQNPMIYKDAPEWLDGFDNNCDGIEDNDLAKAPSKSWNKLTYNGGAYWVYPKDVFDARAGTWDADHKTDMAAIDWSTGDVWIKPHNAGTIKKGNIWTSNPEVIDSNIQLTIEPRDESETVQKILLRFDHRERPTHVSLTIQDGPRPAMEVAVANEIDGFSGALAKNTMIIEGYPNNMLGLAELDDTNHMALFVSSCDSLESSRTCMLIGRVTLEELEIPHNVPSGMTKVVEVKTLTTHDQEACKEAYLDALHIASSGQNVLGQAFLPVQEACASTGTTELPFTLTISR